MRSFFKVTEAPRSGANFSVIATDEMLNGDVGIGFPVSSSSENPRSPPSALIQLRYDEYEPTEYVH